MNTQSMLTKARTDALTAYLSIQSDKPALSPDEMYDNLLLDPQNSPDVMTSPVAEAINSLQLYISRCLNGQETAVNKDHLAKQSQPGGFFSDWGQYNSHYDRWAGREKLRYFAADYIDPALRMNKTQLFQAFEQQINHGKLTEQSVLSALQTYLINYERLTRLVTVNHLEVEVQTQTHVFFLARTAEDPCQFYWRKCVYGANAVPEWSDWLPVTTHLPGDKGLDIWLVWNRQRLHICWAESKSERQPDGKTDITSQYVSAISLNDDGTWASLVSRKLLAQNDENSKHTHYLVQSATDNTEWLSSGIPLTDQNTFSTTVTSLVLPGGVAKGSLTLNIADHKVDITCNTHFATGDQTSYGIKVVVYDADTGNSAGESSFSSQGNYPISVDKKVKAVHLRLEVFSLRQNNGKPEPDKLLIVFDDFEYTKPDTITSIQIEGKPCSLTISDGLSLLEALRTGPETLFSYTLQTTITSGGKNPKNGFNSSYAAWVWEIFFHIPFLVFSRFCAEQRFTEAEKWAGYLFRPGGFRDSHGAPLTDDGKSKETIYWNVIPLHLAEPDVKPTTDSDDPDVIALNNPVQYKLAVWIHYLDVLIAQGDQAYREEERESLARARMYYIQAQQLLGGLPDAQPDVLWQDSRLPEVTANVGDPSSTPFLPPFYENLLTCRERIELRLYNLRHNLSLTGQPLNLPLFAPPTDPEILLAQGRDDGVDDDAWTDKNISCLPPERFPVLLEKARTAVSGLVQLGNTLQSVLRQQDEQTATRLLLNQQKAVQQETAQIQRNQLTTLNAGLKSLNKQITGAEQRRDFLLQQLNAGVSTAELSALALRREAANINVSSVTAMSLAGALDLAPNIFGMADGGSQWGAASSAASMAMQTMAGVKEQLAGIQETTSGYTRRQADWQQQLNSVRTELDQLRSQLIGAEASVVTAQKQLALTLRQQGYAQAVLDMQTTRFTGPALYNWMSGRLASLYWPYYDMVHAQCLNAMRALQYETGELQAKTSLTGTWSDLRQGLLAGEGLMLVLQKLEHDWLTQRKKALEVQRTISLEAHFSNKLVSAIKSTLGNKPVEPVTQEKDILSIKVNINSLNLQADYPDELSLGARRQIKQISITLPALLGPYQDVQAILRYDGSSPHAPGCEAIAISHGMQDSGQFLLDFSSPEFLPFEGIPIGDAGHLILQFPVKRDEQKALLNSLSDIIFHIRYTIRS